MRRPARKRCKHKRGRLKLCRDYHREQQRVKLSENAEITVHHDEVRVPRMYESRVPGA